jgi:hypothetical protein
MQWIHILGRRKRTRFSSRISKKIVCWEITNHRPSTFHHISSIKMLNDDITVVLLPSHLFNGIKYAA